MSIEQLKRTLSQLQSEDPLAWQGYLELAHCYRLLGSLDLAHRTLAAPLGPAAPPEVRMRAVAEAAQLTIAEGQPAAALSNLRLAQDEQTDPAPELDFALLDAILALWETAASDDDQESMRTWQKQAAAVVARIERAHGSYWGRRAALQLMRVADSGSSPGNAEILGHAGDNLYLKGQLDEAVVAYERAAGQARAARDLAAALELESKAASIEQSREQFAAASQRLERLAQEQPDAAEAPRTHLLAAWNAAQDTRVHPDSGPRYVRLLEEHLDRWPTGATADLARLWLGRWLEAHQDWEAAVQAYQGIAADAEPFAEAVPALARCWNQYLARQSAAGEPVDRVAAEAMQFFDALILDSQGQWPASWTAAQRAAAVATAGLRIDYLRDGHVDAQRVLQASLGGDPEPTSPWRESAQSLLVVALAGQADRRDEARQLLDQLGRESPDRLPEIIHRLAEITRRQPSMAEQLAPLQLGALQFTDAANLPVDPRQQLRLDRVQAAALAAAGDVDQALEVLRRLAQTHPHHAQVQIDLARLLTSQTDASSLSQAIVQWQQIARRLRPDTPDWYEAKYGLALALFQRNQTNDRSVAAQQLRYLKATSLVDQTPWSKQVNALLQRCEQE
jgi:hypothetical protein